MNLRNFFLAAGIAAVAVPVWGKGPRTLRADSQCETGRVV